MLEVVKLSDKIPVPALEQRRAVIVFKGTVNVTSSRPGEYLEFLNTASLRCSETPQQLSSNHYNTTERHHTNIPVTTTTQLRHHTNLPVTNTTQLRDTTPTFQ